MWTKISSLEIIIFELKNVGKKWSRISFEIHRAPSEIPSKLPKNMTTPVEKCEWILQHLQCKILQIQISV